MSLSNRIYLKWDEAAQLLGMDREGLRQAMLHSWSPARHDPYLPWLPVVLTVPSDGFMTTLRFNSWDATPDFFWNGRDNFYREVENAGRNALSFSDGTEVPLNGASGKDRWDASHGYGSGWGHTFEVSGDTLYVSPESVRAACERDGAFGAVSIAPKDWCDDGFPHNRCFLIVDCDNNLYRRKPASLFEDTFFLRNDVLRFQVGSKPQGGEIDPRREKSLLRVIRALDTIAGLPKRGAATSVEKQIDELGFSGPNDETIRKILDEARALLPDKPQ